VRPALLPCLAVGVLLAAGACKRPSIEVAGPALPAVRVQVATVRRESLPALLETSGTVRAVQRAAIAAKVAGQIDRLAVTLGQPVRAGDVLLHIAAAELSARVAQAAAQLAQAQRELARERTLQTAGASTTDAVQALEDRLAQAQASLHEAESMQGYTTVCAPFDGVVARKFVEAGDFASPGQPLLQLDGRNAFELEVGLPDSLAANVSVGTALDVSIPAAAVRFSGIVAEISSATDAAARDVTAKIAVPAGAAVRSGQFARVLVPGTPVATLLVPASAVSAFGQMERVFAVADGNRASLRLVKTGALRADRIEIVSGLEAGDRVVLAPPAALRDGQPLEIVP
jgi:RND family efflux transporter MFP subunit